VSVLLPVLPGTISLEYTPGSHGFFNYDTVTGKRTTLYVYYDYDDTIKAGITYQWNKDGTAISNATGESYTFTVAGEYTVTASHPDYRSKDSALITVPEEPVWTTVPLGSSHGFDRSINGNVGAAASVGYGKWVIGGEEAAYSFEMSGYSLKKQDDFPMSGTYARISGMAYGGGKWVAVGNYGKIAYSSDDGENWTEVANSTFGDSRIYGVAYGEGTWVAVGRSGKMATSSNGETWRAVANSTFGTSYAGNNYILGVAYGGGKWFAWGTDDMAVSTDGYIWTKFTDSAFDDIITSNSPLFGMTYGNGTWVAIGTGIITSPDGETWTAASSPISGSLHGVAYGGGNFVAVGSGNEAAVSPDGKTWTTADITSLKYSYTPGYYSVVYGNKKFLALGSATINGNNTYIIVYSNDQED
jgi:hypothetical protein